jgi:hypothetical protein
MYPLTIVSLAWLRGARAQRLLDEVLPLDGPSDPPTFDLLILDEAHHVAPAAPKHHPRTTRIPRSALATTEMIPLELMPRGASETRCWPTPSAATSECPGRA